jgi:hypothetical protein
MRNTFALTLMLLTLTPVIASLSACAGPGGPPPSLLPRAAEAIDPRLPVERPLNDRPVNAALAAKLAELVSEARAGDAAFAPAAAAAGRLAEAAGGAQSEGWVAAQEALSAAIAARDPTTRAIGDIDAIGSEKLQTQGGLSPADLGAIKAAGDEVGAIDQRQADAIKAIQRRLGI